MEIEIVFNEWEDVFMVGEDVFDKEKEDLEVREKVVVVIFE